MPTADTAPCAPRPISAAHSTTTATPALLATAAISRTARRHISLRRPSPAICPSAPGVARNSFWGPRYSSVDMTLGKAFGLPRLRGPRRKRQDRSARQFLQHLQPDKFRALQQQRTNHRHDQLQRRHRRGNRHIAQRHLRPRPQRPSRPRDRAASPLQLLSQANSWRGTARRAPPFLDLWVAVSTAT